MFRGALNPKLRLRRFKRGVSLGFGIQSLRFGAKNLTLRTESFLVSPPLSNLYHKGLLYVYQGFKGY